MNGRGKKLYDDSPTPLTKADLRSARKTLVVLGLTFIASGMWALWSELPVGETMRPILGFFLSFLEPGNRAPALYSSCIVLGACMLIISRMKPYGTKRKNT